MHARAITLTVLLLVLCGLPATAGPVTLLSKADPAHLCGTAGGMSEVAEISPDGRYVVFLSDADNFLPGVTDSNQARDLFFHDRIAGTTVLVSHAAGDPSTAGDGETLSDAVLSADGRWLAFLSRATDLVAGQVDIAGTPDVFLWDRDTGSTLLVSHRPGLPAMAAGDCGSFAISADGSRIVFNSSAPDLIAGQSDDAFSIDAFLYDRATGINRLVSHTSGNPTTAAGGGNWLSLSADGNRVAFSSTSASLVGGQLDPNDWEDVFLYDRMADASILVSHAAGAATTAAGRNSFAPRISADGNRIAYESYAPDLVAGQVDGNPSSNVFLYDRAAGASALVSHARSSATTGGNSSSESPTLSADGRYVAYTSPATDLVAESTGGRISVLVYDQATGTNTLVSRGATTPDGSADVPGISSDGAWVAFTSSASNLVPGQIDTPFTFDTFLWSRVSGSITLVTRTPGSATTAAGGSVYLRINADGNWIALDSRSQSLVDGIDCNGSNVYLYERATGVSTLLTTRGGAVSASAGGFIASETGAALSNDGHFVAFTSWASNLPVPGLTDRNGTNDVFLSDRVTGSMTLVSHASGSPSTTASSYSYNPLVSADGNAVVFSSAATNLVPGQITLTFDMPQLFVFDRTTGETTLVSRSAGSASTPAGMWFGGRCAVSGDGRWVAFDHSGSDLVAGQRDGNGTSDVFLFDRTTGTNLLVSHGSSSPSETGNDWSSGPSISADGRYVAFTSAASDLVPGQGGSGGIFLYDRETGAISQVASANDSPVKISADGRWVLFTSGDANVVPGQLDTNFTGDVFLWDRVSGVSLLVSHTPASPVTAGNSWSSLSTAYLTPDAPLLSADGRWVVFSSYATDLVTGQSGTEESVFLFDRIAGTVTLVSRSAASPTATGNGGSTEPAISLDGRFVTYSSDATDLIPGQVDQNATSDLFLYDRISGATSLLAHVPSSDVTSGRLGSGAARLSADGAWVAFSSASPDLVAGDHDGITDAFLYANPLGRDLFILTPCRILDTRQAGQGPALTSGVKRMVPGLGPCGIPAMARAIVANVTVTQPTAVGYLIFHAGDIAPETTSTINFSSGQTRSNNAIIPLAFDGTGNFAVTPFVAGNGTVHLVIDVSGYFE